MAQTPAEFVQTHLSHELEYMLVAATTWAACHPDRRSAWPKHLVATSEYAAFVHQRNLYEFFCDSKGQVVRKHLGHPRAVKSEVYEFWRKPLNTAVMHLWRRRVSDAPVIGSAHLKDQVAAFATDIHGLWRDFEGATPADIALELQAGRERVVRLAGDAARDMHTPPLDWSLNDPFESWGSRKWWPVGDD